MLDVTPTAILFPGQGSQVPGMRELVASARPDLLEAVLDLVGDDPFERIDESTRFAQPAIFCASLAGWSRAAESVETPIAFAGHSLGELTALAAGGVLDDHDALRLVVLRGALMADSGEASGGGTMLAVLGAEPEQAAAIAERHGVSVANDNAVGQIVLSGASDDLNAVRRQVRADGMRAIPLHVSGAFHSPQMAAAVEPFRTALDEVQLYAPSAVVISCATARPFTDPCSELADALVSPVLWRQTMTALDEIGARAYLDCGPGTVLAKLTPRCVPGAAVVTVDDLQLAPTS
ncbi:MAG: ACP S-malonyltransferase [Solirubrobacteraceae bacterium]|nr:ACP S-malonyltransferase [Solirubrobacteraceae bacterium]